MTYMSVAYLMIVIDDTLQEQESDKKEEQQKGTDGTNMGEGRDMTEKENQ